MQNRIDEKISSNLFFLKNIELNSPGKSGLFVFAPIFSNT